MKEEMIGEVVEIEIDYGCGLDTYMTVSNTKQDLNDTLGKFERKIVRITVEEVQ